MQPLPAWATERKRSRQYVIGKRRSRQRLAQMLGGGVPLSRAAAVERRSEAEVELLLADEGFAALVEHYRRFAELPEDEALAELRRLARDLLHLALRAGDVRAAVFFAFEELRGRDPAAVLARAAIRKARRPDEAPAPRPERRLPPRKPEIVRREADFAWCAATQPGESEAAALAAEEAAHLPARVAATGRKLAGAILSEAEREGTAEADPLTESTEAFAREAHAQGGRAMEAAGEWQERREAFGEGQVGEADSGRATVASPCPVVADPVPRLDRGTGPASPARARSSEWSATPPASSSRHPGLGPAPRTAAAPEACSRPPALTDGPGCVPAQGRDDEQGSETAGDRLSDDRPATGRPRGCAAGPAAPFSRNGPAPPTRLPDWLDRVPGANRAQLLAMKPEERAVTLRTIARFYGFDTS
jgi:hypothetical protein